MKLLGGAGLSLKHFIREHQAVGLLIAFQGNLPVDVQPSYEFGKGNPYRGLLAGFAIRYTF